MVSICCLWAEDYGQGAQRSTSMKEGIGVMVGEAEQISRFEQHVMEDIRVEQVYTAMASSLLMEVSSSHIGGDEEGTDSSASTEHGGMINAPASQY